jgi:vacuolar-type H+-ATPase subunit H
MIRVAEHLASEIIDEAKLHAERISRETEDRLGEVYREAYDEVIAEAEDRSKELVIKAKKMAERESKKILRMAEKRLEIVQENAKNNFDKAVDFFLSEFIS